MPSIYQIIKTVDGKPSYTEVLGDRVVISGFEDFHFFAHHHDKRDWSVYEIITGFHVVSHITSKEKAIRFASDILQKKGQEATAIAIRAMVEKFGQTDVGRDLPLPDLKKVV